ncbi:MAG: type II toxin-antitoxin system RelE/ParE family toxin [Thermoanaerobaculia bacterium]
MVVRFATSRLERCYREIRLAQREWGHKVGRTYIQRINTLWAARDSRDLFALKALDMHPLKGDRRGQFAIRLGGRERLIVAFEDDAWTIVRVEEVSKHYGD